MLNTPKSLNFPAPAEIPGIYIEDVGHIIAPVRQVETALPVFIGFTEKAFNVLSVESLFQIPFRIHSFTEFVTIYGSHYRQKLDCIINNTYEPQQVNTRETPGYLMHYSVKSYFDNGGLSCYIFSTGIYPDQLPADSSVYDDSSDSSALTVLKKVDDITLLVYPDLAVLAPGQFYQVCQRALLQCAELRNRFLIMDVYPVYNGNLIDLDSSIGQLRNMIGKADLSFGAAYFPPLISNYQFDFLNTSIIFSQTGGVIDGIHYHDGLVLLKSNALGLLLTKTLSRLNSGNKTARLDSIATTVTDLFFHVQDAVIQQLLTDFMKMMKENLEAEQLNIDQATRLKMKNFILLIKNKTNEQVKKTATSVKIRKNSTAANLKMFKSIFTKDFHASITARLNAINIELPASAAVAGIYSTVDRTKGVWKAPTGINLQEISALVYTLNDREQASLNSGGTGISINAIRDFTGKGIQVWGARTLDENNSEWRYVPVRRLFNMVEESVKNALESIVFEPNNIQTWRKVKNLVSDFLIILWRNGALAGIKPEQAYYTAVGLNETMTQADLQEGRLIAEIGMAPVKPAEFIILRFMIKMCSTCD